MFKKKSYHNKPAQSLRLNSLNEYPQLIPKDTLCRSNLQILTIPEFKRVLEKATRDLNMLLHMTDSQFWREFAQNQSVNACLQSCLAVFSKRQYDQYALNADVIEVVPTKDPAFVLYSTLLKIVLFIYYRISSASTHRQQEILYQQWLLDIPKMLDLAGIYGGSNCDIVKKIIFNLYENIEEYDRDTTDFFNILERHPQLQKKSSKQTDIDFTIKSLRARNYGNRESFMMQETTKQFFKVKDLLINLTNFIRYFPRKYVCELATDYKIQERLMEAMAVFLRESHEDWKLQGYDKYFQLHFEDLRQVIAIYFVEVFRVLRSILEGNEKGATIEIAEAAEDTYQTLCLCLTEKQQQPEYVYMKRIFNHLLEESEETIFFVPAADILKADDRTRKSIEECVRYEKEYRREKRLAGTEVEMDQAYSAFKKSIKKQRDITAKRDGAGVRKLQEKRQAQRLQRQPLSGELYWNLNNLKHAAISKQYQDEPEQEGQFHRAEMSQISSASNANLSVFVDVNNPVNKAKPASELSVWDLSQLPQLDDKKRLEKRRNEAQVALDETSLIGIQLTKQIKRVTLVKEIQLSFYSEDKENKVRNVPSDLSIFNINGAKQNKNNLQLSMLSEIQPKDQQTDHLFEVMSSFDDKDELANMIAGLSSQVSTVTVTELKTDKQSMKVAGQNQPEFEMFEWESEIDLSFEMSNYC